MYKHIFRFAVTTITILAVNLLTSKISDYMIAYKSAYKPLTFTLIAMGIITLLFYPLFTRLEMWLNVMSAKLLVGNSMGGKYMSLISIYLFCLLVLFYFYARMWYNIDIIKLILNGNFINSF